MTAADSAAPYQRGLALHRQRRLGEAEALYRAVLAKEPSHFGALHLTGLIHYQLGKPATAAQWIGRALAVNPDSPEAHSNLGLALLDLKQPEQALATHTHSLHLRPTAPHPLTNPPHPPHPLTP